jgi:site-specific recombinase
MTDISGYIAALPGFAALVTAVVLGKNSKAEIKQKADMSYVTLTKEATDLLLERMQELKDDHATIKEDHARCNRNVATLRKVLIAYGIPVPDLE